MVLFKLIKKVNTNLDFVERDAHYRGQSRNIYCKSNNSTFKLQIIIEKIRYFVVSCVEVKFFVIVYFYTLTTPDHRVRTLGS